MELKAFIAIVLKVVPEGMKVDFDLGVICEIDGIVSVHAASPNRIKFSIVGKEKPTEQLAIPTNAHSPGKPSPKQESILRQHDLWDPTLTYDGAWKLIALIYKSGREKQTSFNQSIVIPAAPAITVEPEPVDKLPWEEPVEEPHAEIHEITVEPPIVKSTPKPKKQKRRKR